MSIIPKIIHCCWFGGGAKNELITKCIDSWKKYCPDYTIYEWNETNFDLSSCIYVQEAYAAKKWAFVSDYVRIWALNQYGGIYLDTDVEITASMDHFLAHTAFTGFEKADSPFTAVFGCVQGHPLTSAILSSYVDRHFLMEDGSFDLQTNTESVTNLLVSTYSIRLDNSFQQTSDGLVIYPNDYFCPKSHADNIVRTTKNTHAIHWFDGSWMDPTIRTRHQKVQKLNRLFGERNVSNAIGILYCLNQEGLFPYIKKRIKKYLLKK